MAIPQSFPRPAPAQQRGSVLITALLIATALGLGLVSYINLGRNALKLSQRTFYVNCAANLAEAGLEEAVFCFRLMDAGTAISTAWNSWTLTGGNASLTLPAFSCGQNAVGLVKVYVTGYDGTLAIPSAVVQATITPFDGSKPVIKTLKVSLKKKGAYNAAINTTTSMSLGGQTVVDSFNSNPTGVTNATRLAYPGIGANQKGNLIAYGGTLSLGSNAMVNGDVILGTGVASPSQSQVTGSIITNYTGAYPVPAWPSWPSGSGYYGLWSFPAVLPRDGDTPAADGRFYYYPAIIFNPLTLGATTITDEADVTITATSVSSGLTLGTNATCLIWTGDISTSGATGLINPNWAGALQIYSWGTTCNLGHNGPTTACIYAPLATVKLTGGGPTPSFTGSIVAKSYSNPANWTFHYDESLKNISPQVGTGWSMSKWYDLQGTAEIKTLSSLTGGFMK
jgi:hypothetical protein